MFVLRCHRVITYKVDRSSAHRVGFMPYTRRIGKMGDDPLFGGQI